MKYFILKNSGNLEQAKDVFHDGILKILVKIKQNGLGLDVDLSGYLFITCKNIWIQKARRDTRITFSDNLLDFDGTNDNSLSELLQEEKITALNKLMKKLGDTCQKLIRLTYFEGLNLTEAADLLGYSSPGVAGTTQHRCREKLRVMIQNSLVFNELTN